MVIESDRSDAVVQSEEPVPKMGFLEGKPIFINTPASLAHCWMRSHSSLMPSWRQSVLIAERLLLLLVMLVGEGREKITRLRLTCQARELSLLSLAD